jgi:hypothetical protein
MILALVAIGGIVSGAILAYLFFRRRKPVSLEDGLSNFRRGLDALDPANDPLKRNPPKNPPKNAGPIPGPKSGPKSVPRPGTKNNGPKSGPKK